MLRIVKKYEFVYVLLSSLEEDSRRVKAVRQLSSFHPSLLAREIQVIHPKVLGSYSWQYKCALHSPALKVWGLVRGNNFKEIRY